MKNTIIMLAILVATPIASTTYAQSSIEEIEADIAARKAANKAAEAVNPSMEIEEAREATETEVAMRDLLEMRRLFEQLKLVRRQANEVSDQPEINAILLDSALTVDQKFQKVIQETKKALDEEKEAKAAAAAEAQRIAQENARLEALGQQQLQIIEAAPEPEPEPEVVEEISVTFVHEFKDDSPTKVGFKQGIKLGVTGVVGSALNGRLNGIQYTLDSVERVGFTERSGNQPIYSIVMKDPDGQILSLSYQ